MRVCRAQYEPTPGTVLRGETHTCKLPRDHRGAHLCPLCQSHWVRPRGEVAPPAAEKIGGGVSEESP